jgi:hypothetical protein
MCHTRIHVGSNVTPGTLEFNTNHNHSTTVHTHRFVAKHRPRASSLQIHSFMQGNQQEKMDEQSMIYADVLQDTWASVEFISMELALRKGLKLKPTHNNWTVTVANQETVKVLGSVNLQIDIHGYTDEVKFLVIPMAYDMILGNRWARSRQAIADYGKTQTTVIHNGNTFVLKPYVIHPSKEHTLEYPQSRKKDTDDSKTETSGTPEYVLNFAKATKAIRRGADYHAIEIQKVPDPPPKPPDPKDTPDIPIPTEKSGVPRLRTPPQT